MPRPAPLLALALALATSAVVSFAQAVPNQTPPSQSTPVQTSAPYSIQVKAQVVVLDVVVTDKAGNIVPNLTKDDFLVTEDKAPQTIRTLDQPGSQSPKDPPPVSSTAELDRLEPNAPVSIIVLGDATLEFKDQAYARYSLKQYLKAQSDILSQPVMLAAIDNKRFQVLQDYTTSKQALLDALDHHFVNYAWAPTVNGLNIFSMFGALETVAHATGGHPGHKNLIWIGTSYGQVNVEKLPIDTQGKVEAATARCTNLLRDSRVTLYNIDPKGVGADIDSDSIYGRDPFGGNLNLTMMAVATGGKTLRRNNDVDAQISSSLRDGINFYTLTYVPPAEHGDEPAAFRKIDLKMRNPEYRASTREGYFAGEKPPSPAVHTASGALAKDMVEDVNIASGTLLVYDDLPMTVNRDPATPDKFTLHLTVANGYKLTDPDGKPIPELIVLTESFDRKGKQLSRKASFVNLHSTGSPAEAGGPVTRVVDYPVEVATAQPAARIRIVVRDNTTGKLAADNVFLIDKSLLSDRVTGLDAQKPRH